MQDCKISRRDLLAEAGLLALGATFGNSLVNANADSIAPLKNSAKPFKFCLNMATIRGQKLGIVREIEIAGQAGYDAIEPWVDSIQTYVASGGKLADLKKQIQDAGMTVEDAIAFPQWLSTDGAQSAAGIEDAKKQMDIVAQIDGKRIAAPPAGATDLPKLDWQLAARRYRALLDAGKQFRVLPQFELWGFSQNF